MPRVPQETLDKLNAFIESLPQEARAKCSLCNDTLTHLVKTAEVETGAGTATVARVLAEKINEGAAPQDRVSSEALKQRVRYNEGLKCQSDTIKPQEPDDEPDEIKELCAHAVIDQETNTCTCENRKEPWDIITADPCEKCKHFVKMEEEEDPEPQRQVRHKGKVYYGIRFAEMAIEQLKKIEKEDPLGRAALVRVREWVDKQLQEMGGIEI